MLLLISFQLKLWLKLLKYIGFTKKKLINGLLFSLVQLIAFFNILILFILFFVGVGSILTIWYVFF